LPDRSQVDGLGHWDHRSDGTAVAEVGSGQERCRKLSYLKKWKHSTHNDQMINLGCGIKKCNLQVVEITIAENLCSNGTLLIR